MHSRISLTGFSSDRHRTPPGASSSSSRPALLLLDGAQSWRVVSMSKNSDVQPVDGAAHVEVRPRSLRRLCHAPPACAACRSGRRALLNLDDSCTAIVSACFISRRAPARPRAPRRLQLDLAHVSRPASVPMTATRGRSQRGSSTRAIVGASSVGPATGRSAWYRRQVLEACSLIRRSIRCAPPAGAGRWLPPWGGGNE